MSDVIKNVPMFWGNQCRIINAEEEADPDGFTKGTLKILMDVKFKKTKKGGFIYKIATKKREREESDEESEREIKHVKKEEVEKSKKKKRTKSDNKTYPGATSLKHLKEIFEVDPADLPAGVKVYSVLLSAYSHHESQGLTIWTHEEITKRGFLSLSESNKTRLKKIKGNKENKEVEVPVKMHYRSEVTKEDAEELLYSIKKATRSEAARIYFYPFGNPAVNEKGSKIETWMELDINKKNNCMVSYEIKFTGCPSDLKPNNATLAWKYLCEKAGCEPKPGDQAWMIFRVYVRDSEGRIWNVPASMIVHSVFRNQALPNVTLPGTIAEYLKTHEEVDEAEGDRYEDDEEEDEKASDSEEEDDFDIDLTEELAKS